MRPLNALALYRARLRARLWQELLAIVGIGAGVALLFASQVANSSLQSSIARLSHGLAGRASLQLRARDPHGLPQGVLAGVRELRGVKVAAPVLEADANAIGPRGSESVQLIGADAGLSRLGGTLTRGGVPRPFAGIGAVALSAPVARKIGARRFGQEVLFQIAGRTVEAPLYTQPHEYRSGGPLAEGYVALAPLSFAQELAGLGARVSRILVEPLPGQTGRVRAELQTLAAGRLDVAPIDREERLFGKAAAASDQSSSLFAAISALVGFLFAFNAMLLTVAQRRRLVVDLRRDGYGAGAVTALLALDGAILGLLACALGLVGGDELSIHVLHSNPAFLSLAFTLGSGRVVGWQSVSLACAGGMLAAVVAVLSPLRGVLSRDAPAARRGSSVRAGSLRAALGGLTCLAVASAILLAEPDAAIPGMVLLVAALLLVLPSALALALSLVRRLAGARPGAVAHVAARELSGAGGRAVAIAATGALAVFGSVAIQGAHDDLLAGLEGAARDMNASADVWVAPAGSYDLMHTAPFAPVQRARLARLPGARAVELYRGGLLDYGERRALVIAPPPDQVEALLSTRQVVQGSRAVAARRVREGGWLVLSQAIADEAHVGVGQLFTLPSPRPRRFRIAALSTNLGWAPGTIVMGSSDFARAWGSGDVSAYGLSLDRGARVAQVVREAQRALGPHTGLVAQAASVHAAQQSALSRQALARLTQIATLIPIVAVLAMAAAISAMIWQRRPRLAKLRIEGLRRGDLWRTILFESLLLLGVGCLVGAGFGLYGQQLADRALAETINFPVVYSITVPRALSSVGLMAATALAVLAVPGWLAASAPVGLAMQE